MNVRSLGKGCDIPSGGEAVTGPSKSHREKRDKNLTIGAVTEISRAVVLRHDPPVELVGVVPSEGANDRAEIVVRISGCHAEPCRLVVNVSRGLTAEEFGHHLGVQLQEAIAVHTSKQGRSERQ